MVNTFEDQRFFEVLPDPAFRELWFPGCPRPASDTIIDPRSLADDRAEAWHTIRGGKKIEVRLVSMDKMRYSLSAGLDGILEIDAREFKEGRRYEGMLPSFVPIDVDGPRPEFTLYSLPIVSQPLAELIDRICAADVQRFPGYFLPSIIGYKILNVTATADCLDEARSAFKKFTPDGVRPDLAGEYRDVERVGLTPIAQATTTFSIRGWEVALIVSERLRLAMQDIENLGVAFRPRFVITDAVLVQRPATGTKYRRITRIGRDFKMDC